MSQTPSSLPNAKKKQQAPSAIDIMRPGNGTPWEDRGSVGFVGAYFQTVVKSLTAPALLVDHIKRPESTSDARAFAIASATMWALGVLIWNAIWYFKYGSLGNGDGNVYLARDGALFYWISAVAQAALFVGGVYLFMTIGVKWYTVMAERELKQAAPSLIFNCFAYGLGPSIFALVPFYGWIFAALYISVVLVIIGRKRLYVKWSSAVINIILISVVTGITASVAYVAVGWVWAKMPYSGVEKYEPPAPKAK